MLVGSVAYCAHCGVGAAAPTQFTCCTAFASPVLSIEEPITDACGVFWNTPIPPRTTARGPRTAPSNAATCGASPIVFENPRRGLKYTRFGTTSLRAP